MISRVLSVDSDFIVGILRENQMYLADVVIQMLELITQKGYEYRHIIDKGVSE